MEQLFQWQYFLKEDENSDACLVLDEVEEETTAAVCECAWDDNPEREVVIVTIQSRRISSK